MRLFLISPKECKHISELIPGISSVYQLEQEFAPHLTVDFIPNHDHAPGILLIVGDKVIRRNYTFDDPNDIEEMRRLIWKYIRDIQNPTDITDDKGCIKNFIPGQTNRVIQSWAQKKDMMRKEVCCKKIKNIFSKIYADNYKDQLIKHEVYRYSNDDRQNLKLCKENRFGECMDNYPRGSALGKRCLREATWVCENGYPCNKTTDDVTKFREELKNNILKFLKENNMKVNKQVLDIILSSGFFERVRNRMGNKAHTYENVQHVVNGIANNEYDYFSKLIEGYKDEDVKIVKNDTNYLTYIIIALLVGMIVYFQM